MPIPKPLPSNILAAQSKRVSDACVRVAVAFATASAAFAPASAHAEGDGAEASAEVLFRDAKKLMALGYLSGSDPGRLAPSGGDRPGLTDSAWNNLGLYLCGNPGKVDLAAAEAAYRKAL